MANAARHPMHSRRYPRIRAVLRALGTSRHFLGPPRSLGAVGSLAFEQDVAGDLLFLLESKKYTYKEWVGDLSVPYITFFVVAAGASIATVVGKIVLVVQKSRSRGRARARAVAPAIALARSVHEDRLAELDGEIEANRLDQRKLYVASNVDCV